MAAWQRTLPRRFVEFKPKPCKSGKPGPGGCYRAAPATSTGTTADRHRDGDDDGPAAVGTQAPGEGLGATGTGPGSTLMSLAT